jgi:hypothetical protein
LSCTIIFVPPLRPTAQHSTSHAWFIVQHLPQRAGVRTRVLVHRDAMPRLPPVSPGNRPIERRGGSLGVGNPRLWRHHCSDCLPYFHVNNAWLRESLLSVCQHERPVCSSDALEQHLRILSVGTSFLDLCSQAARVGFEHDGIGGRDVRDAAGRDCLEFLGLARQIWGLMRIR